MAVEIYKFQRPIAASGPLMILVYNESRTKMLDYKLDNFPLDEVFGTDEDSPEYYKVFWKADISTNKFELIEKVADPGW